MRKGNPMFTEFLNEYKTAHFLLPDSSLDQTTNVVRITNICLKYGFIPNNQKQTIRTFTLLPQDYLCPKSFETGKTELTKTPLRFIISMVRGDPSKKFTRPNFPEN